jgi:hypothetical protein
MSVTCRDVSLVSVVSVNCGAIYRQTEKRQVQLSRRKVVVSVIGDDVSDTGNISVSVLSYFSIQS